MRIKKFFAVSIIFVLVVLTGCHKNTGFEKSLNNQSSSAQSASTAQNSPPSLKSDEPCDHAILNVVVDNPLIGDEHQFVRLCEWPEGDMMTSIDDFQGSEEVFHLSPGKSYAMMIYVHNAADYELGETAAAEAVALVARHPEQMQKGEQDTISATFAYGLEDVQINGSAVPIQADADLELHDGVILEGAELEYTAMWCNHAGDTWGSGTPESLTAENLTSYIFRLDRIMPGYEGAGFIFIKLDAVAR